MACIKPESFLTEEELMTYLGALSSQSLTDRELSKQVKNPLFKVRSTLRELERLEFIKVDEDTAVITEKGRTYLTESQSAT